MSHNPDQVVYVRDWPDHSSWVRGRIIRPDSVFEGYWLVLVDSGPALPLSFSAHSIRTEDEHARHTLCE